MDIVMESAGRTTTNKIVGFRDDEFRRRCATPRIHKGNNSDFKSLTQICIPRTLLLLWVIFMFIANSHGFLLGPREAALLPAKPNAHPDESLRTRDTAEFHRTGSVAAPAARSFEERSFTMPRAFDTSFGSNFTELSCPRFFKSFLGNPSFTNCAAISLMLQTSVSFFDDTKSKSSINRVLDISCSVPREPCSSIMNSIAQQLLSPSNCLNDYNSKNPVVIQAYSGLVAYNVVYEATCLKDSEHNSAGSYCYTDAITNTAAPTSSYIYFLPLGASLPAGTTPTCNSCLRQTMNIFASYAANASQPLSHTYPKAAARINAVCGPGFAISHVKMMPDSAMSCTPTKGVWIIALIAALFLFF